MIRKLGIVIIATLLCGLPLLATPHFSVAGYYPLDGARREIFSMSPNWLFHKGELKNAFLKDFDDGNWEKAALSHGIELLPEEASGGVNYQGVVWYRKHFEVPASLAGKKLFLYFEAIMGKSKIYINGEQVKENLGGFLPIIIDATGHLQIGDDNVIAVMADNSDDPSYPPGKPQKDLDFAYFGGIYRDCWLIAHNQVYITDANYTDKVAGGGLFISFEEVSKARAKLKIDADIANESGRNFRGKLSFELTDKEGRIVASSERGLAIGKSGESCSSIVMSLKSPNLWSPENPYLYNLNVRIKDSRGKVLDGYTRLVGIRSVEFKGADGFWLNGEPYPTPLIGGNRHQDYAVIGNAAPNSLQWRDALKLRRAGMKVIRSAHYPLDPAFMDACDRLGLFVIVATPGWQFWNKEASFEQRVYKDIRNMVRRDRNRPCVWLWEPILNETGYPDSFAKRAAEVVREEYPYNYCHSGGDAHLTGNKYFEVQYMHPLDGDADKKMRVRNFDPNQPYFTREWGDNVDDWSSHNSRSRVSRGWGETPMLMQAQHYASPSYPYTSFEVLYSQSRQHIGGCLWHSFDHQRGYHPDPFYGGIMDAFRQPKLSYYMFCSQRNPRELSEQYESGPMLYIANAMTPFSSDDVVVYSNCDEVRLSAYKDGETMVYKRVIREKGMPYPIIVFENVLDIQKDKKLAMSGKHDESFIKAEGYIDGQLVAQQTIYPARRPAKLLLQADTEKLSLKADGGDLVTIIASVTDKNGNVKRLNNSHIFFEIEGEGEIVANHDDMTNPVKVEWGTAPIIIRATDKAGDITIRAKTIKNGIHTPISGEITIRSEEPDYPLL